MAGTESSMLPSGWWWISKMLALTYTCGGISNGVDYFSARDTSGSTVARSFLHRAQPKTRGPKVFLECRRPTASIGVNFVRHERGGAGKRRSLISSFSGCLTAWPKQRSFLSMSCAGMLVTRRRRRNPTVGTQSLRLMCRMCQIMMLVRET